MRQPVEWRLPPSLLDHLERLPRDRAIVLMLRHSVRDELPPGPEGNVLPITKEGERLALELGALLGGRLKTLHTSPLRRCVQTAEGLRAGASATLDIVDDHLLGDPGAYVIDPQEAGRQWRELGHERVMAYLVSGEGEIAGLARPREAARFLVQHMLHVAGDVPGVHVFVTHDSLIGATVAQLIERPLDASYWPWFIEGAFFWRGEEATCASYRDLERLDLPASLCGLQPHDVLEFARRELNALFGAQLDARLFLAGGAFKSLLTGAPPRDLDIWTPSQQDRKRVLDQLLERGAEVVETGEFSETYRIGGRLVELPFKTTPDTLQARLDRFDIALSAVGVEHRADGTLSAIIHPLAQESVAQRRVLLLKPLVNWRYALSTLERARRYAAELGFELLPEEEEAVWRVFEDQPPELRAELLRRYERLSHDPEPILKEASCRFP